MNKRTIAVASAALLTFAGGAYAVAGGSAPTAITSSVTDKLGESITAKYPGSTIVGIHSLPGGGFGVEVRKSDATDVHVSVDANFKVTGELAGGMGMRGGMGMGGDMGHHGGPGMFDTAALAKTLGVTEDKLTAALDKVRQANDPRGEFAAALAKSLNASTSDVQSVLDAQRGASGPGDRGGRHFGPGGGPGGPDNSALVTALAKKLNVSESKVKDALDAARPDKTNREQELATALAKELDLDAATVQKALSAQHP